MSLRRISSSGRFIKRNGLLDDPRPEVGAEKAGRNEVDPSTEKSRQLGLKGNESETKSDPGLELDEDVEIALSPHLAPDCRPEHCEFADAVTAAETAKGQPIEGKGEETLHETMLAPARPDYPCGWLGSAFRSCRLRGLCGDAASHAATPGRVPIG
jgi:hypothetical protein